MSLCSDTGDTPGKRVAVIVDSRSGHVNSNMLAQLRIHGFYLITGVSNTAHATQEIDRSYGLFKSVYRDNLVKLTKYRVSNKSEKKTIQPTTIPLLFFVGGPQDIVLKNAFDYTLDLKYIYQNLG